MGTIEDYNIDEIAEGAILLDGLEDAILGVVEEFGNGRRVLYSKDKIIGILMERDGMDASDEVFLAPIFTAREKCSEAAEQTNAELAERLTARGNSVRLVSSLDQLADELDDAARPGDVLITMGAGDINRIQHELTRRIQRHPATR